MEHKTQCIQQGVQNISFLISNVPKLTIDSSGNSTFGGNVKLTDEKILGLRNATNDYALQYRDLEFRLIGSQDSSTQRKFSFGYYTSDNPAGTWNGKVYINSYTGDATFAGNVGIGVTGTPSKKLHVVSTAEAALFQGSATWGTAIQINATATGGRIFQLQSTANSEGSGGGNFLIVDKGTTAAPTALNRLIIDSSGDVGIGTDDPDGKLHVQATNSGVIIDTSVAYTPEIKASGVLSDLKLSSVGNGGNLVLNCESTGASIIQFTNGGAERMRITSGGKVGIGDDNPLYRLTVAGAVDERVLVYSTGGQSAGLFMRSLSGGTQVGTGTIATQNNGDMKFFTGSTSEGLRMTIGSTGRINMFGLDAKGTTGSDVRYNTSTSELYYLTSSKRYKTNIVNLESSLDKINALRPVRFKDIKTGDDTCGLIAEETFEIIPDVVFTKKIEGFDEPQIEGLNYSDLVPFLIKSIQELKAEVDLLKKECKCKN